MIEGKTTKELTSFETTDEGREVLEKLNEDMRQCFRDMKEAADSGDNELYHQKVDEHYELKQVRNTVQNKLTQIVRANMLKNGRGLK